VCGACLNPSPTNDPAPRATASREHLGCARRDRSTCSGTPCRPRPGRQAGHRPAKARRGDRRTFASGSRARTSGGSAGRWPGTTVSLGTCLRHVCARPAALEEGHLSRPSYKIPSRGPRPGPAMTRPRGRRVRGASRRCGQARRREAALWCRRRRWGARWTGCAPGRCPTEAHLGAMRDEHGDPTWVDRENARNVWGSSSSASDAKSRKFLFGLRLFLKCPVPELARKTEEPPKVPSFLQAFRGHGCLRALFAATSVATSWGDRTLQWRRAEFLISDHPARCRWINGPWITPY